MKESGNSINIGKIVVRNKIGNRMPVLAPSRYDKNRKLMIKFKYGTLTDAEANHFHESLKKLIYKVMHTNNVMMDWEDVYQEIWRKIVKCRHTWNENHGTMVSTWITIVATSVINTMKKNIGKYRSRYVLYDDLVTDEDSGNSNDACDIVASQDDFMETEPVVNRMMRDEQYVEFISMLSDAEKYLIDTAKLMDTRRMEQNKRGGLSLTELRRLVGYDQATFNALVADIRSKISKVFGNGFLNLKTRQDSGEKRNSGGDGTIYDLFLF